MLQVIVQVTILHDIWNPKQLAKADGAFLMVLAADQYILNKTLQLMSFKSTIKSAIRRIDVV